MTTNKKIRTRVSVTIDGVKYASRTAAAVALYEMGGMTQSAIAEKVGMTPATVHANTVGKAKRMERAAIRRVIKLGRGGKMTASEIGKRVEMSAPKVVAILKKEGVKAPTKEELAKANAKAKSVVKVTKKTTKKTTKAKAPAKTEEELAQEQATADMALENVETVE
jgi:transcriptional regulator with XRE-family HTH domain